MGRPRKQAGKPPVSPTVKVTDADRAWAHEQLGEFTVPLLPEGLQRLLDYPDYVILARDDDPPIFRECWLAYRERAANPMLPVPGIDDLPL